MNLLKRGLFFGLVAWSAAAAAPMALRAEPPRNHAKWNKEIAAFERMDKTNPPPKGAILFTGSSTIRKWTTVARDLPGYAVINRGFGGSEISDSTFFASRIIFPYAPRMVVLRAGGNDLANGRSVETVFADYKDFAAAVHTGLPSAEIVFIGWSPSIARWRQHDKEKALNELVVQFTKTEPYLRYIEDYDISLGPDGQPRPELFVADKLHFSAQGYQLLAEKVRSFLARDTP